MATGSMPSDQGERGHRDGAQALAARNAGLPRSTPSASIARAASSSKMAFLATRPTSMMMPMKLIRLSSGHQGSTTPISGSGAREIITAGRG